MLSRLKKARPSLYLVAAVAFAVAVVSPEFALAAGGGGGGAGAWANFVTQITDFKNAVVAVCAALCVIGFIAAAMGWFMRSQEGMGTVFWGGVTMAAISAIILVADQVVTGLAAGGALIA